MHILDYASDDEKAVMIAWKLEVISNMADDRGYQGIFSRNEEKYLLTEEQYDFLMSEASEFLSPDEAYPHSDTKSIYFDSDDFYLARRCLEKPAYRTKIRLRCYGEAYVGTSVFLEQKSKYKGTSYKRREEITYPGTGHEDEIGEYLDESQISKELKHIIRYRHLKPQILISYSRDSFNGNNEKDLRITFDRNIRYAVGNPTLNDEPSNIILPKGNIIMEAKTLYAIPQWLNDTLTKAKIFPISFSKYTRIYEHAIKNGVTKWTY